jgi:hypothetical protein
MARKSWVDKAAEAGDSVPDRLDCKKFQSVHVRERDHD